MSDTISYELEQRADEVFAACIGRHAFDFATDSEADPAEHRARLRRMLSNFDALNSMGESPIERIMAALLSCSIDGYEDVFCPMDWDEIDPDKLITTVVPQAEVKAGGKSYRVDFLITCSAAAGFANRIVIECDGHDYHERTKSQAQRDKSRDRSMVAAGYTVYRFTGSELFRHPYKCMEEVEAAMATAMTDAIKRFTRQKSGA